jgi:hypothetical protein
MALQVYVRDEATQQLLRASELPRGFLLKPGSPPLEVTVRFRTPGARQAPGPDGLRPTNLTVPADELEHFVVPCSTNGCEETLTLTAETDR